MGETPSATAKDLRPSTTDDHSAASKIVAEEHLDRPPSRRTRHRRKAPPSSRKAFGPAPQLTSRAQRKAPTLEETIAGFPDEESWELPGDEAPSGATAFAEQDEDEEEDDDLPQRRSRRDADDEDEHDGDEPSQDAAPRERRTSILDPPLLEPDDDDLFTGIDDDEDPPPGTLQRVVTARVGVKGDKVADFDVQDLDIAAGDHVIVETERGAAVGTAISRPLRRVVTEQLPRLLRRIDDNDLRQIARNEARQREAFAFCAERIHEQKLPMKLIRVEYLHSGNKALFYFAAENRIDFRELVRNLARHLRVRVEMRQIGVRDAAGMLGGIGACGQQLCCALFLQRFDPVSIRMAKDQNLVLNPTKVSGQCGRLKCCLGYEQRLYQKARKNMPKSGSRVTTPDGDGIVRELDIPRQLVTVLRDDGATETYTSAEIASLGGDSTRR